LGPISVLDLASGSGAWGIALAQASPHVTVRAIDWPDVLPVTRRLAERFGVGERFTTVAGDLLEADFGSSHQVPTLGHILHSEGVERSRALLRRTHAALVPGGTIAIAEFLVDADRRGPMSGLIFAVNMLVNTESGNTYSFDEIAGWLTEAGFINPHQLSVRGERQSTKGMEDHRLYEAFRRRNADARVVPGCYCRPRSGVNGPTS